MLSVKSIITTILVSLMLITSKSSVHALPFLSNPFARSAPERASCEPIRDVPFKPHAYSQLETSREIERDCSVYGFELFSDSEEGPLPIHKVSCGSTITAKFRQEGQLSFSPDRNAPENISNRDSIGNVVGVNNFSQHESQRETIRQIGDWQLLYQEMGSIYTWERVSTPDPRDKFMNTGLNARLLSRYEQINNRLDYCSHLRECQGDNWADRNEIIRGNPAFRCVNPMNIEVYPDSSKPSTIINEMDICDRAETELAPFTNPLTYFSASNPNKDQDFIDAFWAMEPASKAREQMVVCQSKAPDPRLSNNIVSKFRAAYFNQNKFDCQEVIIPPGLVSFCQGILRDSYANTPYSQHEDVAFYAFEPEVHQMGGLEGPLIYYDPGWFATIGQDSDAVERMRQYARRINGAYEEGLTCSQDIDSETYGDPGYTKTSDPIMINTQARLYNPNEYGQSELEDVLLTFTIEPRGISACANALSHLAPYSFSRRSTPHFQGPNINEGIDNISLASPIGFVLQGRDETQKCEPAYNDEGQQIIGPDGQPELNCRTNIHDLEAFSEVNKATTIAGNFARYVGGVGGGVTNGFCSGFKSYYAPDNCNEYKCDWYAFTNGVPPVPGCVSSPNERLSSQRELMSCDRDPVDPRSQFSIDTMPSGAREVFNIAAEVYAIPVDLLVGIAYIEGRGIWRLTQDEVNALVRPWTTSNLPSSSVLQSALQKTNCSPNFASAAGPMQMTPGAFNPHQNAAQNFYRDGRVPNVCNLTDAVFAAAQFLVRGRLPIYGYQPGSSWDIDRKVCAAAETYYGSCRMDRATCNVLGNNYCDFIMSYMGRQPFGEQVCHDLVRGNR